jgi:monoamine oxidase
MYDVLIIGAGAAGLMAMRELLRHGASVCMLEGSMVPGGRIATQQLKGFEKPVETGAEFVHGRLPLTLKLLRKAGINYHRVAGKWINVQKGIWNTANPHDDHWKEFMHRLKKVKKDLTIKDFLGQYFNDASYKHLRQAVQGFAEGFDLADISKASMLSVKKEWEKEDQPQYRIEGGYSQLIDYLVSECNLPNGKIIYGTAVSEIHHDGSEVVVYSKNRKRYTATKVIITSSIGALQQGILNFSPAIPAQVNAIKSIGFGPVIKIIFQFKNAFWKKSYEKEIGFLLTDEKIPTWWTQAPGNDSILTGWLGGPKAALRKTWPVKHLFAESVQSLANIFHISERDIASQVLAHSINRWQNHAFACGGYSYNTLLTEAAIEILREPVNQKLFFAGEGIYNGEAQGTVEAALQSGLEAAKKIIKKGLPEESYR